MRALIQLGMLLIALVFAGCGGGSSPTTPTGLNATPGNGQVLLTWTASTGATSYHVKRATTSGGAYTQVGAPTCATYTDTGRTNGTKYYYVVSAVNSVGESGNSNEASATPAVPTTPTLSIPVAHPRLWWTPERRTQAQAWYAAHPFTPSSDDPLNNALRYVLTGENTYAQIAITALMNFTIAQSELDGVASDNYRWNDWVPVVFDWCYDAMTDNQRLTFMARYNGYVDTLRQKTWGGPGQGLELNNYFWGYMRNEINWGIATYYEQTSTATTFLNFALTNRLGNDFIPFAASNGYGGVLAEGCQYGLYTIGYRTIPFKSLALMGRDLDLESDFFKQTAYYLLYATTNTPTHMKGDTGSPFYQYFPFNDDEQSFGYPDAADADSADFMTMMAEDHSGSALGQYARHWVNQVQPDTSLMEKSVALAPGAELPFTQLPVDYYGSGEGILIGRSGWTQNDTQVVLQLKALNAVGHSHIDAATFQIWRRGYWVSKESTGYVDNFSDTDSEVLKAHNGLLMGGLGYADGDANSLPEVTRLESRPTYLYTAVDLTGYYRNNLIPYTPVERDNPYAGSVIREFLFIRPLQTLVILDRAKSIVDTPLRQTSCRLKNLNFRFRGDDEDKLFQGFC